MYAYLLLLNAIVFDVAMPVAIGIVKSVDSRRVLHVSQRFCQYLLLKIYHLISV